MIKNFRLSGIEAKRFIEPENAPKEIRIDNNSTVLKISRIDDGLASVEFRFTITYAGIGMITMEGNLTYEGNVRRLMDEWVNRHRMPDDVAQEIHGTIINNCVLEAVIIAKQVHLPPPIPPPAQFMAAKKTDKMRGNLEGYA